MAAGDDETMEAQLARLDMKVENLDAKVETLDKKVDALSNSTKMQFEELREDIKKLGEGYESGFTAISRQIQDLDKTWTGKWSIHDAALKNHGQRISKLEEKRT